MALTLRSSYSFISPVETNSKAKTSSDDTPVSCSPPHRPPPPSGLRARAATTTTTHHHHHQTPATFTSDGRPEQLHRLSGGGGAATARVPVYVMLPLDTVSPAGGRLSRARALNASMMALRSAGVEGVMVDVWWGLVEKDGPLRYDWEPYVELAKMAAMHGLKLQMVMSFHQCGGNVGDSCSIPLPPWVQEEMSRNPDILYTDRSGRRNPEYISLGCDMLPVLRGRTPLQVYSDYMRSFRDRFINYLGDVIVQASGNPLKSWMVPQGPAPVVTEGSDVSQWADTMRMALGSAPGITVDLHDSKKCLAGLSSMAINGDPWGRKKVSMAREGRSQMPMEMIRSEAI